MAKRASPRAANGGFQRSGLRRRGMGGRLQFPFVTLPRRRIPHAPASWDPAADLASWSSGSWDQVPELPPFTLADGSGPALQQTRTRVCWDEEALHVRFDCEDRDAWGTYRRRDDPIYKEEAVEIFLAPGEEDPTRYFEFELSPAGVVFDARVHNPTSRRIDMEVDPSWDCPGLRWACGAGTLRQDWWAVLSIPWRGIAPSDIAPSGDPPRIWRANFYRIERPRGADPEFSCWSATFTNPADFHRPASFGILELTGR